MSAPSMPPDNSMAIEQSRMAAEERRRAEERQAAAERKQELAGLRNQASTAGRGNISSYFSSRGLDPAAYSSGIDNEMNRILAGIAPDDPNPGSYFSNAGESAWNSLETGERNKSMRELDKIFSPNFETKRVGWDLDDPYLAAIEAEQRSSADAIIRNMLDRGVITQSGFNAASGDLDRQAPGVRSRLNEIGTTTLAGGQQKLRDISNNARQTASNLSLGTQFDPFEYGSEADRVFNDFIQGLGDTIRGKAPGNLFQTAGLGAIAGAGMGAQNTPFDPNALSGMIDEDEDEEENKKVPAGLF